jgi:Zn-dependent protease
MVRRVLLAAIAVSIAHYTDNTLRFDDYEAGGTPSFITQASIPVSWVLFTAAGIGAYLLLRRGRRSLAAGLLGFYSISGLIGPLHYTDVPPGDFDLYQNVFIVGDSILGVAVALVAIRVATGGTAARSRAGPPSMEVNR